MPETDRKILADIKSDVCDTVLRWTVAVGVTAVALSLFRIIEFGFLPVMALHICLSAALSITYLIRRRLHFNVRAGAVVAVMIAVAIGGHLSFGVPTRIEFFIAACIMATVFFGESVGILTAAVSVAILGLIYVGFLVGAIPPPTPVPALSATNWIANAASMVVASIAPLIAVSRYRVHLERERQRVIAADRAKSDFLATMSHELRTPMTAILGVADLLLSDKSAEHVRDKVSRISSAGRLLLDLLNDLLDYSKIESNTIVAKPAPFKPRVLIEEICQLFTPLAAEKGVVLNAVLAPGLPETLLADWGRLRQALLNLLGNAVKFTEQGSITVRVSADRREAGLFLAVEVTDTGIGISPEQQERLFQPFMQADQGATRRYGGTGLGLVISRRLIELMGGTISVHSVQSQGSTFTITIPVAELSSASAAETQPAIPAVPAPRPTALRILVVDDSEPIRFLFSTMLEKWGHRVVAVDDGLAAVAAVRTNPYDVILMDMHMPGMDGPSATRMIRSMDTDARHLPIIAVTADILPESRQAFLAAGATALMVKPVDWPELARRLEHFAAEKARRD